MSDEQRASRREVLKRVAKAAVYTTPAIYSLAAPRAASAQLSEKMGMMFMKGQGLSGPVLLMGTGRAPPAPWAPDKTTTPNDPKPPPGTAG